MKAARVLIHEMKYDPDAIIAALDAIVGGRYWEFGYEENKLPRLPIDGMEILYSWGEPPLMERFLRPPDPPEIYSADYDKWVRRYGEQAIKCGAWDGIYLRDDPRKNEDWLKDIIGDIKYEVSKTLWTRLGISQQSSQSSDISQQTQQS